jgi:hypothetical protein
MSPSLNANEPSADPAACAVDKASANGNNFDGNSVPHL